MEEGKVSCFGGSCLEKPDSWRSYGCKFSVTYGQRMRGFKNEENVRASSSWHWSLKQESGQETKACLVLRRGVSTLNTGFLPSFLAS